MPDLDKVINGLETFKADLKPYAGNHADWQKVDDALSMLKAQEPVEPKILDTAVPVSKTAVRFVKTYWCGACGEAINQSDVYCRKCGQAVKWDADGT